MRLIITEKKKEEWILHPTKGWRCRHHRRPKTNRRLKRPKPKVLTYFEKFGNENPTKTAVKARKKVVDRAPSVTL